jgi:hypothetical protein
VTGVKDVPIPYVKANQTGIVICIIAALALNQPWLIAALWVIQTAGLLTGGRWNLFVRAAAPFLNTAGRETQAAELQRFNNTLAVIFLTLSTVFLALGWTVAYFVFAAMLLIAAGAALLGKCIGCIIYYQYKQAIARRRT